MEEEKGNQFSESLHKISMKKCDICRQYRDKYPGMQLRTLAKLIFSNESIYFKSIEDARQALKYVTGKNGERDRTFIPAEDVEPIAKSTTPFTIPMPESEDLKPYKLPVGFNNFILCGDIHVPNHRIKPIEAMIDYAQKHGKKQLIINGDLLDNTPFTRHFKKPMDGHDVRKSFDDAEQLLLYFKQFFDEVYWLEGNHDFWYKRWLISKAPELFGDPHFDLETRLKLIEKRIHFIGQEFIVKAGDLSIVHGHMVMRGGILPARTLFNKMTTDSVCSHVHKSDSFMGTLNGKQIRSYTTGCLCTLTPEYSPQISTCNHGFADIVVLSLIHI